jgi:hypothetical protein
MPTRGWKWLAIGLAMVFAAGNTINALNKGGDALVFFEGGRRLLHHEPLYDGSSAASGFIGPPFQALFFAPFAAISMVNPTAAKLLWYVVNLACLAMGMYLTLKTWSNAVAGRGPAATPSWVALVAPIAAVILPLQTNFEHQNMNALLLALIAGATWHLSAGSVVAAGVLVGTATALKAFPVLLLVYFAVRRFWTALGAGIITTIALTALPALVYGFNDFLQLIGTWLSIGSGGWPIRGNNQSLIAALDRATGAFGMSGVRTPEDAPLASLLFVVVTIGLAGAALSVIVATRREPLRVSCEVTAMTVLAVLLAPIAWDHYWTLLFPAFFMVHQTGHPAMLGGIGQLAFWTAAVLTSGASPLTVGREGFSLARQLSTSTVAALVLYGALLMVCRRTRGLTPEFTRGRHP